jgi:stage II sporulation protein AA (anti-sigma F factor antagonist)
VIIFMQKGAQKMDMQVKQEGRCLEIYLKGELDHHAAKEMMRRLDSETELVMPLQLTLDFSGVAFMDSSGIGMLMGRLRIVQAIGGTACLICENKNVLRILEMSGVMRLFNRCKDIADAVKGA